MITVTFVEPSGARREVVTDEGEVLMQAAVRAGVEGIEAACGGAMACGTCHAYVERPWFDALPQAEAGEQGILDFGVHVVETSRLTCQIRVSPALAGAVIVVPPSQS